ncbi:MAG TPA: NADH-quinone oxidoreductase subunit NuoG [Acidimicrobiales bacterium]|nr:NADH-quinone oxidoreductase subunit NuoG [Acidimicrobiales bacterium]
MTDPVEPGAPANPVINVDGKAIEARPGEMIIAAAERGGVYIPRFCWHPRMKPVGMCRMCLVEVNGPRGMALMPACYVPVSDGQEIVTTSDKVKKAQDGVLEFLLINHPLDCPVCDRGGECPLQDQTFAFGPGESRFVEEKRHWQKPIPINNLVALDRERCIQCARCTRFAEEVAGDPFIDFIGRSDHTEVNTFPGESFESNFSANIVQICPVGALTSTPYRFKARPWDLEVVESTCTACAVGCRMAVQSSQDRLIRHLGIDSEPVNHGWLCDKGRFGYEAVVSEERLTQPLVRKGDELIETSWHEALKTAADGLRRVQELNGSTAVAILGGARLANEDAYAWSKLARTVLGTDNVDCQMGDGLPAEVVLGLPRATIDEVCSADVVLLVAPDIKEELPVFYLRLRAAAIDRKVALVELAPQPTALTEHAVVSLLHRPGEAAAAARKLVSAVLGRKPSSGGGVKGDEIAAAAELLAGKRVVVVLGRPSLAEPADGTTEAAAVLAANIPGLRFLSALRRGNVHGALDMGLAPGVLPGRVSLDDGRAWFQSAWGADLPGRRGLDAHAILAAAATNQVQGLVLIGANPMADFPDRTLARRGLAGVGFTVVVDTFLTDSAIHADVVLPAATYAERPGTTTNMEGRVTRLGQKVTAPGTARPDWMIATELASLLGGDLGFESIDGIATEIERVAPAYAGVNPARLAKRENRDGFVVPLAEPHQEPEPPEVAFPPQESIVDVGDVSDPMESIEVNAAEAQGETLLPRSEPDAGPVGAPESIGDLTASDGSSLAPTIPLISFAGVEPMPAPHAPDAYSLRLVTSRSLYDAGALVQHSESLKPLATVTRIRACARDLSRLAVRPGDLVRVSSSRAALVLEAALDDRVPRGSAVIDFNQPGDGAADLVDVNAQVTDVRIENVKRPSARKASDG